jgi:exopolysaccharide production protein ExoZ
MTPAASPSSPRLLHLRSIQYLRAAAALMVAYFHAIDQIPGYRPDFDRFLGGGLNLASGVDIFFVISGFIMLITNRNGRPGRFALRRLIRIVPLYWLLTLLLVGLTLWQPAQFRSTVVSPSALIQSLLFIPYMNPGHPGEIFPLLVPGWTLNLEMFFYAVFALVLFAPERLRVPIVGAILGSLVLLGLLLQGRGVPPELLFYTDSRLVEFWLGMLIAHVLIRDSLRLPRGVCVGLVAVGFAMLLTGIPMKLLGVNLFTFNITSNVLPAAGIIVGTVCLERSGSIRNHPWLHWLGDASYSIYLTHIFSLGVARFVWHALGLEQPGLVFAAGFAVFSMALVVAGAGLVYSFIEVPTLEALQRLLERRRPPGATISNIAQQTPR